MTNCNPKPIPFSPLNRKKIEASFSGGAITSDGGLLLLREVDKKLGLTNQLSKLINDDRHPSYTTHSVDQMLKQRIYAIAAGYEDINDHDFLRQEVGFQTAVGKEVELASSSTLSRFENSIDRQSLVNMSQLMVEQFIASHKQPPSQLILDFDPTDDRIHGQQDQRHFHGYYGHYCFLPLYVFCGDKLLVSMLRPSNIDGSKYAGAILKLLVQRFREVWPSVQIIFRGDCAFSRKRILHWCEHNNVHYIVGIARNNRLESLTKGLMQSAEQIYHGTGIKQRLFTSFHYAANSWHNARRVIAKAEYHVKGSNLRFVTTNLPYDAQKVYDDFYCPRGDMENKIKQQQLDLFADRTSCHDFWANQFRVLLSSFAYILITELKHGALSGTSLEKAYCQTIRNRLFKIGAVIIKNTRRIRFLLSSYSPNQEAFTVCANNMAPT